MKSKETVCPNKLTRGCFGLTVGSGTLRTVEAIVRS